MHGDIQAMLKDKRYLGNFRQLTAIVLLANLGPESRHRSIFILLSCYELASPAVGSISKPFYKARPPKLLFPASFVQP